MDGTFDKRPTLRSLAEITGLGVSTVSQALRNSPDIAEETRRRVQLAAQQAGYRPNRAGVRLRTGKTNVIAVVLNAQDQGSEFFSNFVFGVTEGLVGSNYHLVITPYALTDPMGPVRYIVETGSADGVILSRTQPDDPRLRYLKDHGMPFVTHGRTEMEFAHPCFDYDNEAFCIEALRLLKQKGRRKVTLLGPVPGLTFHKHTHIGFQKGLGLFGLTGTPLSAINIDTPLPDIRRAGRELGLTPDRPDGFVCSAVGPTMALATGLRDAGLAIGRDFDVVTKHSTDLLAMLFPEINVMQEDFREAGRAMARLLMAAIGGADAVTLQELTGPGAGGASG